MNQPEKIPQFSLRVSHFCFALDREMGGGAGGVFLTASELSKFGILSEIYSSGNTRKQVASNSSSWADLRSLGINIFYSTAPFRNVYGISFLRRQFSNLHAMQKSNLVILHQVYTLSTFLGYRFAKTNRIPFAVFPHGSLTTYHESHNAWIKSIAKKMLISKILQDSVRIIVTSESEKVDLSLELQKKAILLPYGAENRIVKLKEKKTLKEDFSGLRILFCGRFDKKKNLKLLLKALPLIVSQYPSLILDIAGSGSKKQIKELIIFTQKLNIENSVKFHGWVKKSQVENLLDSAQVLVLPSENENFAQVVSEALSHGVPCAVSRFVGTSNIVAKHHAGEIIKDLTPESIAEAILKVLSGDRQVYREAALTAASAEFDWLKIALKWRAMIVPLAQTEGY